MKLNQHPDDQQLQAYLQEPEADRFIDISLHLASCVDCRQQLAGMQKFKSIYRQLKGVVLSNQQQQRVDEFTQQSLSREDYAVAQEEIRAHPAMLKSALYSLSLQPVAVQAGSTQTTSAIKNQSSFITRLIEWFNWPMPLWSGVALASVITMMVTLVVDNTMLQQAANTSLQISSYQDSENMRFIPPQTVPGIGFFSAAKNYTKPYQGLQVSLDQNQQLQLQWQAVDEATQYQVALYRFSNGNKQLVKKVTTQNTYASLQLQLESFNQRFEWTLSGSTSQQVSFTTSGGFVISQ